MSKDKARVIAEKLQKDIGDGKDAIVFQDLKDAAGHMVEEIHTYEPRQDMHDKYMKIYERYEKVYQAVRPLV